MRSGIDWPRFRRGCLYGLVYATLLIGVGFGSGLAGTPIRIEGNLAFLLGALVYGGLGWWAAVGATTRNQGAEQGISVGVGMALTSWALSVGFFLVVAKGEVSAGALPAFLLLSLFSELKFGAIAGVAGMIRGKQNDPTATIKMK